MQAQLPPFFFGGCFPEAAQAQFAQNFWQLFSGGSASAALFNFLAVSRFCAGAALTIFFDGRFRRLCRRSCHQFSGSFFLRLCRRSSHQFSGSCFSQAARAQLSQIFWHLFFRRLCKRSSHQFSRRCFPETVQGRPSPIFWQVFLGTVQAPLRPFF